MSSQLRDLCADRDERDKTRPDRTDVNVDDGAADGAVHPRGVGFRVLSRLARHCADPEDDYAPRHRGFAPDSDRH